MNEVKKALQAGDRERAFALLRRHLAANPKDANAWLWMSEATTNPKQKIDALKRVLMLAPQHPHAAPIRQRLERLTNKQSTVHSPPVTEPISPSPPSEPPATQPASRAQPSEPPAIEEPIRTPPKAIEVEAEPLSFAQEEPPLLRQRLGIREERKSKEQSIGSIPPADSTVAELRQSLMSEAGMSLKDSESEEPSAPSPPKPPSEEGLPKWVWLIMLVAIVGISALSWIAYNMMQAN